jgi:hypothetical protein
MGPSFEFRDFRDYIYLRGSYENIPMNLCLMNGALELGKALLNMASVLFLMGPFDNNYCGTKEFGERNIFYKVKL